MNRRLEGALQWAIETVTFGVVTAINFLRYGRKR